MSQEASQEVRDSATLGGVVYAGTGPTQYPATAGNIQVSYNS
jgi:hypothetical protein